MLRLPPSRTEPRPAVVGRLRDFACSVLGRARVWCLVLGLVAVAGSAAFGPLVRSRIASEGDRRGLDITVGSVRPGIFAVRLRDVGVRLRGVRGIEVKLDEVQVALSGSLSVSRVAGAGGRVFVEGEPEEILERLRAFRREARASSSSVSTAPRTPMAIEDLSLTWKLPGEGELVASGLGVARDETLRVGWDRAFGANGRSTLEVRGGAVEFGLDGVLRRASAASMTVGQEPLRRAASSVIAKAAPAEPEPPPLPAVKGAKPSKAIPSLAPVGPILPLPDLHAFRRRIASIAQTLGARVPDRSKVEIGGLSVKLDVGGEPFVVGPGPFVMERHGDVVRLTFASEKGAAQSTPLSIDTELPLGTGDVTVRLAGGPVSLSLLGVKEGTKGLFDVAKGAVAGKGRLVLSASGDALTFDGQVALHSISVKQPRLASEALRGVDLAVTARGLLDDAGRLRLDDARVDMGALHLRGHGTIEESREHFGAALTMEVATASCQALLESAPAGLLPTLRASRMTGTFGATLRVLFDTRSIDKLDLNYDVDDKCRMAEVGPELARDRFSGSFTYRAYHPDGTPAEVTTGPETSSWTNLDDMSPFLVAAVLTTEDGAFYKHHGFNHNAIRSSVAANVKARRFVRGASTITMQLAKNLFLSREKTLSRKIEEIVLADYLEQVFRKDDMMELYLNVIEFGPDVYGVTRAAEHYFGRKPSELNLPECFFLASIMPSPVRYGKLRDRGQVSDGWMRHIQKLMEIAAKNGKVSAAELTEGLARPVVFHRPGDPPPEPRRPVNRGVRDGAADDAAWAPL